jgi:diacylglycerol kinase family enzyme
MKILSIGKTLDYDGLDIISIEPSSLPEHHDIEHYSYIIINGGDGTIRRVLKQLHDLEHMPIFILNPTGSFNVVAKIHRAPKIEKVLAALANLPFRNTTFRTA